jgi:hypothetical protein
LINGSWVRGNESDFGGGISTFSGTVIVEDSSITNNRASSRGGGLQTWAGSVTLTRSVIPPDTTDVCLTAGYRDLDHLRGDPDFDALRGRRDFQDLCAVPQYRRPDQTQPRGSPMLPTEVGRSFRP